MTPTAALPRGSSPPPVAGLPSPGRPSRFGGGKWQRAKDYVRPVLRRAPGGSGRWPRRGAPAPAERPRPQPRDRIGTPSRRSSGTNRSPDRVTQALLTVRLVLPAQLLVYAESPISDHRWRGRPAKRFLRFPQSLSINVKA